MCSISSIETEGSPSVPSRSAHNTALVDMPMNHTNGRATTRNEVNNRREQDGEAFGPMQRHAFRHQFAKNQREHT